MQYHNILSDRQFEVNFENYLLNPVFFTHEAHLRLAWIHITKYGVDQAAENLCQQIKKFDQAFGTGTKFNKTVTVAAVRAVDHFIKKSKADNFQDFIREFPQLKQDFKGLMSSHYSRDIFNDPKAKSQYLEPDLSAF